MMNKKMIFLSFVSLFLTSCVTSQTEKKQDISKDKVELSATLSGAVFVTKHLEESVQFYTNYLGFKEYKRMVIKSETGLAPFGLSGDRKLNYVALIPAVWSKENPNFPGLNFIEILDAETGDLELDENRKPIVGEIMKAYSVKGLVEIEKQLRAAGIPIITPLAPSLTGKSMTLCVIDPNGVRIQMYEYIKKK